MLKKSLILPVLIALLSLATIAAVQYRMEETDLSPGGEVYEVNPGADGKIYLSDYDAQQIWQIDPLTSTKVVYQLAYTPVDARPDSTGNIWWTEGSNVIGRVNVQSDTITTWLVPDGPNGAILLGGLTFDQSGMIWLTEYFGSTSNIFRLTPRLAIYAGTPCRKAPSATTSFTATRMSGWATGRPGISSGWTSWLRSPTWHAGRFKMLPRLGWPAMGLVAYGGQIPTYLRWLTSPQHPTRFHSIHYPAARSQLCFPSPEIASSLPRIYPAPSVRWTLHNQQHNAGARHIHPDPGLYQPGAGNQRQPDQ